MDGQWMSSVATGLYYSWSDRRRRNAGLSEVPEQFRLSTACTNASFQPFGPSTSFLLDIVVQSTMMSSELPSAC